MSHLAKKEQAETVTGYKNPETRDAYLVEFSLLTRVVVDNPDGKDIESVEMQNKIAQKAAEKIRQYAVDDRNYPVHEDIVRLELDTEVPFDKEMDI